MCEMNKNISNTELYESLRSVPNEARKEIAGGPLKGFTDINPMWRIKRLTETFGPCGLGWRLDDIKTWEQSAAGETAVFVSLNLYVKYNGEWSSPIYGIGGSKSLVVDRNGAHLDDEAYKKAYTDAISIACKALGMAADIYFDKDVKTKENSTKYDVAPDQPQENRPQKSTGKGVKPAPTPSPTSAPTPGYTPLDEEDYWKIIGAYATGKKAKSGNSYRDDFKTKTNAGEAELAKFDNDVRNYKYAHGIA